MIQAYQIHRFFECRLTGQCHAEVTFKGDASPELQAFARNYQSRQLAVAFLTKEARDWFLAALEKFVAHKSHIITKEHPEQQAALQICQNALAAYEKFELAKIAEKFLGGFKYFQQILPHPHNGSHESSVQTLNELRKFCEGFSHFKKVMQ